MIQQLTFGCMAVFDLLDISMVWILVGPIRPGEKLKKQTGRDYAQNTVAPHLIFSLYFSTTSSRGLWKVEA